MAEPLTAVLVGCGGISQAWLKAAKGLAGLEITGLVDLVEANARKRQAEYNLERAAVEIRSDISESLVSLQFQDRVGQVLEHLRDSIALFPVVVSEAGERALDDGRPLDPRALLDALAANYTMAEEHHAHQSGAATKVSESEITFF